MLANLSNIRISNMEHKRTAQCVCGGGGGGSARRSTGFARLCVQGSGLLRDWMVRLRWRQFSSVTGHLGWRQSWSLIGGGFWRQFLGLLLDGFGGNFWTSYWMVCVGGAIS